MTDSVHFLYYPMCQAGTLSNNLNFRWCSFFVCLFIYNFLKIYLLIMLLQLSHFPPSLHSFPPTSSLPHSPLQFMSMGHTYKFFGFYISYTILTLPLSIFHLSSMLLILCPFPPSPPPTPLLTTLHEISISMVLFLFQLFAQFTLVFVLGVVVNNCEFAVIFTVPIFDLLFLR